MIDKHNAGFVYDNNSAEELANLIIQVLQKGDAELDILRGNARSIYDQYFSPKIFEKNVRKILKHTRNNINLTNQLPY